MNEKSQLLGVILFVMVIFVGLALITSSVNTGASVTNKAVVTNESNLLSSCYTADMQVNESNPACNVTLTNAPTGWKLTEGQCALGSVVVTNSAGTELTEDTDYIAFDQTGLLQFLNTTDTESLTNNVTLTSYNYCPDGYLKSSGDRSLMSLIGTLMIMVLLIAAAGYAYAQYKK